jgi:hypothetical protein
MLLYVSSRIMPRTTLDLDAAVLRELKRLQRRSGKPLGRLVSELVAAALAPGESPEAPEFRWASRSMGARVDLEDKDAVRELLDRDDRRR